MGYSLLYHLLTLWMAVLFWDDSMVDNAAKSWPKNTRHT